MEDLEIDRRILQMLESAQAILDVGCGDGRLVNLVAHQAQRRVVGLDISNHGFAEAKQMDGRISNTHLVECVEGDARHIGFKRDCFEAVIMVFTLHHIEETRPALREVYRVLKPGGKLLLYDWVAESEDQDRTGCHRFTVSDMLQTVREAGFQKVGVEKGETDVVLLVSEVSTKAKYSMGEKR